MTLIIPLSADLPYLFFCLEHGHSEEDRTAALSRIKAMLKDELSHVEMTEMTPKRVHAWMIYIYHAASEDLLELRELGNMLRCLLVRHDKLYIAQLRTELLDILSKSASCSMKPSDADSIRRIKNEAAAAKFPRCSLGYSLDSLELLADGIANGDFLQATA